MFEFISALSSSYQYWIGLPLDQVRQGPRPPPRRRCLHCQFPDLSHIGVYILGDKKKEQDMASKAKNGSWGKKFKKGNKEDNWNGIGMAIS